MPWSSTTEHALLWMDRAERGLRAALSRYASREIAKALFEPIVTSYKCWCCTLENSVENTHCFMCEAPNPEPKWR
jgi:hypothetical protein